MKWLYEIAQEIAAWDPVTQGFLVLALCACVYSCETAVTRGLGPSVWVAPTPPTPTPAAQVAK